MTQAWRQFQGQVVDGKFPLSQYLGGSDHSAVFLTQRPQGEPKKAAIKLIAADPKKAQRQLSRWAEAAKLSHPHLLRLFEMGRCKLANTDLLYLVIEYAEEDLAQVVSTRPLTPAESQDMLPAVLDALGYIHRQGFVHGHIKPANIMAAQEQVRLACDGLCRAGESSAQLGTPSVYDPPETATEGLSPAADVWSLGMLLVEVLTQKVPVLQAGRKEPTLPALTPRPMIEVVRHCLRLDRTRRWTVAEIMARLGSVAPLPEPSFLEESAEPPANRPWYLFAVITVAIVLIAVLAGARFRPQRQPGLPAQAMTARPMATPSVAAAPVAVASVTTPSVAPPPAVVKKAASGEAPPAVLRPVLPRVPQSARDTITGTVRVRVRVAVDQDGNVASARFDSMGPSKYFARLSMQAARRWRFTPASDDDNPPQEWLLRFEFRRDSTHAFSTPISR